MKNKTVTYALITAVAVLWGLIFYRIFSSVATEEKPVLAARKNERPHQAKASVDSFRPILSYRDPFLGTTIREEVKKEKKQVVKLPVKPPEPPVDWSFINYFGVVYSPAAKKKVALLSIHGKDRMMMEGENVEDVKLLKNFGDSVKVSYLGKTNIIKRP